MLNSQLVLEKCQNATLLHPQIPPNVSRGGNLALFANFKSEVIFGGGGILGWSDPNFLSSPGKVPIRGGYSEIVWELQI